MYRAKEALNTDTDPTTAEFSGQVLPDGEGRYQLVGKGGILSDADAEKFGLTGDSRVEQVTAEQLDTEQDERNRATHGAQAQALANPEGDVSPQPNVAAGNTEKPADSEPAAVTVKAAPTTGPAHKAKVNKR